MFQRIRDLREDKDLTQQQVSDILSCSRRQYAYYESGDRTIPPQVLIDLSNFYDVSIDYILGCTNNKLRNK